MLEDAGDYQAFWWLFWALEAEDALVLGLGVHGQLGVTLNLMRNVHVVLNGLIQSSWLQLGSSWVWKVGFEHWF